MALRILWQGRALQFGSRGCATFLLFKGASRECQIRTGDPCIKKAQVRATCMFFPCPELRHIAVARIKVYLAQANTSMGHLDGFNSSPSSEYLPCEVLHSRTAPAVRTDPEESGNSTPVAAFIVGSSSNCLLPADLSVVPSWAVSSKPAAHHKIRTDPSSNYIRVFGQRSRSSPRLFFVQAHHLLRVVRTLAAVLWGFQR